MFKKLLAVAALSAVAILAGPVAANAADPYVPNDSISVSGSVTPGGTAVVTFKNGAFAAGENVALSVTGEGPITLSVVKASVETARITKTASAAGAVALNVKLPTDAKGTYSVTGTGLTSGRVGTASLTIAAADGGSSTGGDSGQGLAFTGANVSPLIIWGAGGIVCLGIALLIVMGIVRRQRAAA